MDIVRKSKNSESLCDHCRYAQDCTVYVSIGKCYDILSCAMDRPLPSIPPNIDYYKPRKMKEKDISDNTTASEFIKSLNTFNKDNLKKIQDDFKKKSIDEKLNIIYGRLILPAVSKEKTGKWIDEADKIDAQFGRHTYKCSKCDKYAEYFISGTEVWWDRIKPNYCPNCGAKMEVNK